MISVEEYYTEIYVSVTLIQGQKLVITHKPLHMFSGNDHIVSRLVTSDHQHTAVPFFIGYNN